MVGFRDIKDLGVKCDNVGRGCTWEGTVGTFEDHLKRCDYTPVYCPKKCKAKGIFLRRDMPAHLVRDCPNRSYRCEHCGKKDTYATITEVHSHLCLMKKVPCTNAGCAQSVERGRMDEHIQTQCEYTVVPCKYCNIGCSTEDARKFIEKHEAEVETHFPLSLQKIVLLDQEVTSLKQEMLELKGFMKEATALLKDETVTLNHETSVLKKDTTILQDDTALLRSDVDTLNRKVIALISVPDYNERKTTNDEFLPETFFTVPNGYKIGLVIHPNGSGDGEGSHVSVYLEVLDVPYKEKLQWPLKANVKVELLNQLADKTKPATKNHITYVDSICAELNSGWLCPKFVLHSDLTFNPIRNTQYLLDDVLYFRVMVQESLN